MQTNYYLAPNLNSTHSISDDLHEIGIKDWFLHVISNDESGLSVEHIHSSNYIETLDFVREGLIGAIVGLIAGVILSAGLMYFKPFGDDVVVPNFVYLIIVGLFTCFGAWEGGLCGIAFRNKKHAMFKKDVDAGKYLILIYTPKERQEDVRSMMDRKHPEAKLVACDKHFLNPFSSLKLANN